MQSASGVAGKPIYIGAVIVSASLALAGFVYAMNKGPTDLLRETGTVIVPSHLFYWLQGLVFVCVAAYIYRLWTNRCDVHANLMRVPASLSLVLLGAGWFLFGHGQLGWSAAAFGISAAILSVSLLSYTHSTMQAVNTGRHPLDMVSAYLPPQLDGYAFVIAPITTLAGWMCILFYVVLVAALFEAGSIVSRTGASAILIAFLAIAIFPAAIRYSILKEPLVVALGLVTIAANIKGTDLHAVIWCSIGVLSAIVYYSTRDRFLYMSRYHIQD